MAEAFPGQHDPKETGENFANINTVYEWAVGGVMKAVTLHWVPEADYYGDLNKSRLGNHALRTDQDRALTPQEAAEHFLEQPSV